MTLTRIREAVSVRLWAVTRPRLDTLYYANGGIGDELMLTAIAGAARAAGRPIHVLATYPDLWRGNADPASLQANVDRWFYAQRRGWTFTPIVHLAYQTGHGAHIAAQMAAHAGVMLPPGWRPVLHIDRPAARDPGLVLIQNSCRGARYSADTKEWQQARWQELTRRLVPDFRLVQIGTALDPRLELAEDRRGRTSLREAAALLGRARLFIGLESGLQHVAAGMHTPSVIIYGGRSRPDQTGYLFNHNITRSPPCAGCGLNAGCPHDLICLDIPVDEVESRVRAALENKSG
jgi:hypothetical protein